MSASTFTPNYSLSQFAGGDIPDWRTDYSGDMVKIDNALKENANKIIALKPDAYNAGRTYTIGEYCVYNDVIYKCVTAITEATEWDVSYWEATTISKELQYLKDVTAELNSKIKNPIKAVALAIASTTFGANTLTETTADVSSVVPDGYTAIAAIPRNSMNPNLVWGTCSYSAGIVTVRLRNLSAAEIEAAPLVAILCVKNG